MQAACVCWVSQAGAGWQAMGSLRLQAPFHWNSGGGVDEVVQQQQASEQHNDPWVFTNR